METVNCIKNRSLSLRDATVSLAEFTRGIVLTEHIDQIIWLWTSNGCYSAKSLYEVIITGGKTNWQYKYIWRIKLPPSTVKFFSYLWLKGKVANTQHDAAQRLNLLSKVCNMYRMYI